MNALVAEQATPVRTVNADLEMSNDLRTAPGAEMLAELCEDAGRH
ncbi:MAG: hypothetical protein R3A10_01415 [Caldilineaceae bacterium]